MSGGIALSRDFPIEGPDFEQMMREIDQDLAARDIPIPNRPMRAIEILSRRFSVSIPISGELGFVPEHPEVFEGLDFEFSAAINGWFKKTYGDRLNVHWSPGKMAILLDGDIWVLHFPMISGSVQFVLSRDMEMRNVRIANGVKSSILTLVEGMTPAKAAQLSDDTLRKLGDDYKLGFPAIDALQTSAGDHQLIQLARSNLADAVDHLTAQRSQFGMSKWASLQVAEQVFKAAIKAAGGTHRNTHNLATLAQQANENGIAGNWDSLLAQIQCSPGIRYGEVACSREEALAAHHASLALINELAKSSSALKSRISFG